MIDEWSARLDELMSAGRDPRWRPFVSDVMPLIVAVRAVVDVHEPIDAVQYAGARQIPRRVCTGCGTDDGNWQLWPCPTVRAITSALAVPAS